MKRINAWSSPRNISTAFMYSFAQRKDTLVVDEPLYAHYLRLSPTEASHPGTEAILKAQENDGSKVVKDIILGTHSKPVVLFKQMTHHLIEIDWSFLQHTDNIILIRNPKAIINSYAKVIPNPTIHDIGVEKQLELYHYLKKHKSLGAIIDASELLKNPSKVLKTLCEKLKLDFDLSMLSWEAGPRPEDGVWAPYWYHNVHQSTGFKPYEDKVIHLPDQLIPLAAKCQPFYDILFEEAIKA